ncbi:MAG TPA: ribosome maturation factor RimP [Acidimicrobiales bacterium]|nr:ribosome maturation factor RimP [Acidimicrobiales bacterium]
MGGQVGDELFDILAPTVAELGLELVDLELRPGLVRVVVDREGGADLDAIATATRAVSDVLDAHDPMPGHRYTLEVSSPGVERPLRTPAHFARAVGETVTVRTVTGGEGERRVRGELVAADDEGIVLAGDDLPPGGRRLAYEEIERARTVFEWGGAPRPSGGRHKGTARHRAGSAARRGDTERITTA